MINVVVFGMGHLGRWHVDKVMAIDCADLVAVVDPSLEAQRKLDDKKIDVPHISSPEECFQNIEFDAAIVAAPTSLHFDLCEQLLLLGKHVFCEKPMTSTHEEALELERVAKEKGLIFQVGHSERYHSIWEEVKKKSNFFEGSPNFQLQRRAPFKGRATDVDVVQDLMIHDLDLLLYLVSEKPKRIKANGLKIRTSKWDFVRAFLEYENGAHATITVDRNYTQEVREFEVMNEEGALYVDLFSRVMKVAHKDETETFVRETPYEGRDHLLEEQKLFYGAIEKRNAPVVTATEGRLAVYYVTKVLEALEKGTWVEC